MNNWKRNHIRSNLNRLVDFTDCNTSIKAILTAEGVLDAADEEQLGALRQTKGRLAESRHLYSILETRKNGYGKMLKALIECKQSGASDILLNGLQERAFLQTEINFMGRTCPIFAILGKVPEDDIAEILAEIKTNKEYMECFVFEDKILELVQNTIPTLPTYYVPRWISNRVKLNPEIFQQNCQDIFVFKNISRSKLTELAHPNKTSKSTFIINNEEITSRFIILENDVDWEEICNISQNAAHMIKYESEPETYILEETFGTSQVLQQFIFQQNLSEKTYISENDLIDKIHENKMSSGICICDTPGMGKTLLLQSLALLTSTRYPERIVAFIRLASLIPDFDQTAETDITGLDSILLVLKHISPSSLSQNILLKAINKLGLQMELFFDGFDEIPKNKIKVSKNFLKTIIQFGCNVKVYVASRPHHRYDLEETLNVISYDICPFNEQNQINFLVDLWKQKIPNNNTGKLETFASLCLKKWRQKLTKQETDILGIPMQCFFFAEIYLRKAKIYSDSRRNNSSKTIFDNMATIFEMYSKFFTQRFEENKSKEKVEAYHIYKAISLFFPEVAGEYAEQMQIWDDKCDPDFLSLGILEARFYGEVCSFEFVHRTFAEFLVAKFLANLLTSWEVSTFSKVHQAAGKCFTECLDPIKSREFFEYTSYSFAKEGFFVLTPTQPVIAYFLDGHLKAQKPVRMTQSIDHLNIGPAKFYEILQSCFKYNYHNLISFLVKLVMGLPHSSFSQYSSYFMDNCIQINLKRNGESTWKLEYTKPLFILFSMAAEYMNVQKIEENFMVLEDCFKVGLANVCNNISEGIKSPLEIGCRNGNYELVEYFVSKSPLVGRQLFYCLIENSYCEPQEVIQTRIEICELLLCKAKSLINEKSIFCSGPLAAKEIHLEIIKYLINNGANIYATSKLHNPKEYGWINMQAVGYMSATDYHDFVQFLSKVPNAVNLWKCDVIKSIYPLHSILQSNVNLEPKTLKLILDTPELHFNQLDESKSNLLLCSIEGNQPIEIIEELIKRGVNTNAKNKLGRGSLHLSAYLGYLKKAKYFMEKGLSPNDGDKRGNSPLLLAAGNLEMIKLFVNYGADINWTNRVGHTVAHMAAAWMLEDEKFHKLVVRLCKNCDAANLFKIKNKRGQQPLQMRLSKMNPICEETICFILDIPGVDANKINGLGENLIQLAVKGQYDLGIIHMLIKHGGDYEKMNHESQNVMHLAAKLGDLRAIQYFLSLGMSPSPNDKLGNTPLLLAYKSLEMIQFLISEGAKITETNKSKESVAHKSAQVMDIEDFHKLVTFITKASKEDNIFISKNRNGQTPLDVRIQSKKGIMSNTLDILLDILESKETRLDTKFYQKLFLEAREWNSPETIKTLVKRGNFSRLKDKHGRSLLHVDADNGDANLVEFWLSLGLSPNERDSDMNTPLLLACQNLESIQHLVSYKADIFVTNENGDNIAHRAATAMLETKFHEFVRFILEDCDGQDIFKLKNKKGETPLHKRLKWEYYTTSPATVQLITSIPGYDVNEEDLEGCNLFLAAAKSRIYTSALRSLISKGADHKKCNRWGWNALHYAVGDLGCFKMKRDDNERMESVCFMLSEGVEVNQRNENGKTPLDFAKNTLKDLKHFDSFKSQWNYGSYLRAQTEIIRLLARRMEKQ